MSGAGPRMPDPKKKTGSSDDGRPVSGAERVDQFGMADLVTQAFGDPNPVNRMRAFAQLIERVDAENARELVDALKEFGPDEASREQLDLIFFALGNKAGATALQLDLGDIDDEMRDYFAGQMLSGWASSDPQAAIDWFRRQAHSLESGRTLARGLFHGLMAGDPQQASEFLFAPVGPGPGEMARLLNGAAREFAGKQKDQLGFDGALQWAEGLPPSEAKGAALDSIVHGYSKRDPEAASAWAEQFAGEDWAAAAVSRVAEDWAEEDSVASITWLESLPQGAGRSKASYTAFREWVRRDANAASSYIVEMDQSPARDHAVMALSDTIMTSDPEAAVEWATEIGDADLRTKAIERTAGWWLGRDEAAARAWLGKSGLPADVLSRLDP